MQAQRFLMPSSKDAPYHMTKLGICQNDALQRETLAALSNDSAVSLASASIRLSSSAMMSNSVNKARPTRLSPLTILPAAAQQHSTKKPLSLSELRGFSIGLAGREGFEPSRGLLP